MRRPHDPNGGRFRLPEPGLYLVLICDPYEEPSYDDIRYVCDGDHLDGIVARLYDAGFSPEDIHAARSTNASIGTYRECCDRKNSCPALQRRGSRPGRIGAK